jgi:hypothetical protein
MLLGAFLPEAVGEERYDEADPATACFWELFCLKPLEIKYPVSSYIQSA